MANNKKKKSSKKSASAKTAGQQTQNAQNKTSAFKMAEAKAEQIVNSQSKSGSKDKQSKGKKQNRVARYFKELRSEVKKVVWPSGKTVLNNTGVVLIVMCISALAVTGIDTVFIKLLELLVSAASGS